MHKSQGFGSAERRGTWLNDFKNIAGTPAEKDLFEGIDLSWKRMEAGEKIGRFLKGEEGFVDPRDPRRRSRARKGLCADGRSRRGWRAGQFTF